VADVALITSGVGTPSVVASLAADVGNDDNEAGEEDDVDNSTVGKGEDGDETGRIFVFLFGVAAVDGWVGSVSATSSGTAVLG
jgi:hypothetical protein